MATVRIGFTADLGGKPEDEILWLVARSHGQTAVQPMWISPEHIDDPAITDKVLGKALSALRTHVTAAV